MTNLVDVVAEWLYKYRHKIAGMTDADCNKLWHSLYTGQDTYRQKARELLQLLKLREIAEIANSIKFGLDQMECIEDGNLWHDNDKYSPADGYDDAKQILTLCNIEPEQTGDEGLREEIRNIIQDCDQHDWETWGDKWNAMADRIMQRIKERE